MRNQSTLIADVRSIKPSYKRQKTPLAHSSSTKTGVSQVNQPPKALFYPSPISRPNTPILHRRRHLLFGGVLIVFVIIGAFIIVGVANNPPEALVVSSVAPDIQPQSQHAAPKPGLPKHIKIPVINVNAPIDYMGLTDQGDMDIPSSPDIAGWYQFGPKPGEAGSAVIDGHFGFKNHIPAIFDNLHTLRSGDNIYIEDEEGATTTFVVRESRVYNPEDDTKDIFHSSDGKAHLNLITCQGAWNSTQKEYSKRLVVFADKKTD